MVILVIACAIETSTIDKKKTIWCYVVIIYFVNESVPNESLKMYCYELRLINSVTYQRW
jgi:hypothetical protein